ncbi:MAG: DUF3857 domain-containing protein [Saprospiraceae bacterium]|nr:DUF3857 domain-containing protein [Saprospiraceae bacterium]
MYCSKAVVPLCILFWIAALAVQAQKPPIKYGKVELTDLQRTDCAFEPGAAAMVLCDYGESEFAIEGSKGFAYELKRHKRIKILTKSGLEQANVQVYYYAGKSGDYEKIREVKAMCHYLANGVAQTIELSSKDIHTTEVGFGVKELKFAIPGAREGCVIEYQYSFVSRDIANLEGWYFQENIPSLYSEYRMIMPQFLIYQRVFHGMQELESAEPVIVRRDYQGYIDSPDGRTERVSFTENCNQNRWVMKNTASFRAEPFMGAEKDYAAHMEFQLLRMEIPGTAAQEVMSSYSRFNNTLLEDEDFGKYADPGRFEKDLAGQIAGSITEPRAKAEAILAHLKEHIKWDERHGLFARQSTAKVYQSGKGSVAEINLLAVALLRAAGLQADPVILGTRDYGRPHPVYPNLRKFNYVLVAVDIADKSLLLDAVTLDLPLGFLPLKCLNGQGWRVSKDRSGFLPLQDGAQGGRNTLVKLRYENEQWTGSAVFKNTGYAAVVAQQTVSREGEKAHVAELLSDLNEWNPAEPKFTRVADPFSTAVEVQISQEKEAGPLLYLKPVIGGIFTENLLQAESRQWPLDFTFAAGFNYVLTLTVPEGYTLAEKPADQIVVFGDKKDLSFHYRCAAEGNEIVVVSKLQMKRVFFISEEYADLRKFFDLIVQKNQEMLVLKQL